MFSLSLSTFYPLLSLYIYCIVTIPFTFSSFYMYLNPCTMYMSSLNLSTFYPLLSLYSHYILYF